MNLLEAARNGTAIERFDSVEALRVYTQETGQFFPRRDPLAGGVLRALLRHVG